MSGLDSSSGEWLRNHRHRFHDAGAGVRPPDSDPPGRGPPDKSQRALAAAGFVDGPPVTGWAQLELGTAYLVEERRPELSFQILFTLLVGGIPGLVITRQHPDRVRRERDLADVRIIWLSHTPGQDFHDPTAIGTLAKVIQNFIEDNNGEGVVFLDGLDYLVINNGFPQTLMFVEQMKEFIALRRAIILIPVSPEALDPKELALLERNAKVIESTG